MGIYSPYEVYPSYFDEFEPCPYADNCPHSNGDCFDAGECLVKKNH